MKTVLVAFLLIFCIMGCVQKTYTKTVIYQLQLPDSIQAKTVGIRGANNPLNWQSDFLMDSMPDGSFQAIVTYNTGYKFDEVKFTMNNEFEQIDNNRRVMFSNGDTTIYTALFGQIKQ